jgi:uroporphyrinogen-III decarboxylase
VRAHCKRLIDEAGRDGGYIMDASTGVDDAKPENLRAMFEFTREYGVY